MTADLRGKVLTVLGLKEPRELGVVLPHEHMLLSFEGAVKKPEYGPDNLADLTFELKNLGKIRQFPYSIKENIQMRNEEDIISELKIYKQLGGGTVCDLTSIGLRYKPEALPRISQESGVNVIVGTSFYVDPFIPEDVKLLSVEEISEILVKEIMNGIGESGIRCGLIGEVGCSSPLTDCERKSLQAAAIAQQKTGAPLIIHPGREETSPGEIVDVLESAGADLSHTVMSHLDRTIFSDQKLLDFAKRSSCYLEFDLFGIECSHYQWASTVDFPSDAQKIQKVKLLVDNGYAHRILLSHDIHSKHRLVRYGGHGYGHILENIVPKMEDRGIPRATIDQILTENPQKWLPFS